MDEEANRHTNSIVYTLLNTTHELCSTQEQHTQSNGFIFVRCVVLVCVCPLVRMLEQSNPSLRSENAIH